jgi:hypothetical protein
MISAIGSVISPSGGDGIHAVGGLAGLSPCGPAERARRSVVELLLS